MTPLDIKSLSTHLKNMQAYHEMAAKEASKAREILEGFHPSAPQGGIDKILGEVLRKQQIRRNKKRAAAQR